MELVVTEGSLLLALILSAVAAFGLAISFGTNGGETEKDKAFNEGSGCAFLFVGVILVMVTTFLWTMLHVKVV